MVITPRRGARHEDRAQLIGGSDRRHGGSTPNPRTVYAFDVGNLGFAKAWLAMAGFAVATGWVLVESRVLHPSPSVSSRAGTSSPPQRHQ